MSVLIVGSFFVLHDPNSPISTLIFDLAIMLLPLSIGISILRNQLYDIDRLINRTLVYGSLTSILALIYFGCVVLLQNLVNGLTGQAGPSPPIIIGLNPGNSLLFQPLSIRPLRLSYCIFFRRNRDAVPNVGGCS